MKNNPTKLATPARKADKNLQSNPISTKGVLKGSAALKSLLKKPASILISELQNKADVLTNTAQDRIGSNTGTAAVSMAEQVCKVGAMAVNINHVNQKPNSGAAIAQSITFMYELIEKELSKAATLLGIDALELKAWVDLQMEVPAKCILVLLRSMQSLRIDPLNNELGFVQYEDDHWQVVITIEGCATLLNRHSQFNGLVFHQADTLIDDVPEWMECSIYRKDRLVPTTVREYLVEVRSEHTIWKKMPRRMLRHRTLQQCVRLAMT